MNTLKLITAVFFLVYSLNVIAKNQTCLLPSGKWSGEYNVLLIGQQGKVTANLKVDNTGKVTGSYKTSDNARDHVSGTCNGTAISLVGSKGTISGVYIKKTMYLSNSLLKIRLLKL